MFLTINITPPGPAEEYPAGGSYGGTPNDFFQNKTPTLLAYDEPFTDANFYMLEADASGDIVVEPAPETRVYYFTRASSGWTKQEIATAEGLSLATITDAWLNAQSVYGFRSDRALDFVDWTYSPLESWIAANPNKSFWAMHERGYDYSGDSLVDNYSTDETGYSPLHPSVFGAFGTGTRPILQRASWTGSGGPHDRRNLVFQGVTFAGEWAVNNDGSNLCQDILFTECLFSNQSATPQYGVELLGDPGDQQVKRVTFYHSRFEDNWLTQPADASGTWGNIGDLDQEDDRIQGIFMDTTENVLFMECWADHNGWEDGYSEVSLSATFPQPPSQYSHNFYFSDINTKLMMRGLITARAAGSGVQVRYGEYFIDTLFFENNFGFSPKGNYSVGHNPSGHYGVIVAGGGTKTSLVNPASYAQGWAADISAASVSDWFAEKCLVVNGADPNNASEVSAKSGVSGRSDMTQLPERDYAHYNNGIAFDWFQETDWNAASISAADKEASTIGRWLDDHLSVTAGTYTTDTALDWLKNTAPNPPWEYIRDIRNYFWAKAGITHTERSTPTYITFTPWVNGEGWHWCNPMNWTTEDIPGVQVDGDYVNLDGGSVETYEPRCVLAELELGTSGTLDVYGGKTTATNFAGTGTVNVYGAGQFWAGGTTTGNKTVNVTSGRFGVNGNITNHVSAAISGKGELLVLGGNSLTIGAGQTLTITGHQCLVGFDDDGGLTATLTINGTLAFVASASGFSTIQGYRSGHFVLDVNGTPVASNVTGSVVLASGSTVTVDTTGLGAGTYILAENVTDNGATLPGGVTVNGSSQLQVVV